MLIRYPTDFLSYIRYPSKKIAFIDICHQEFEYVTLLSATDFKYFV